MNQEYIKQSITRQTNELLYKLNHLGDNIETLLNRNKTSALALNIEINSLTNTIKHSENEGSNGHDLRWGLSQWVEKYASILPYLPGLDLKLIDGIIGKNIAANTNSK